MSEGLLWSARACELFLDSGCELVPFSLDKYAGNRSCSSIDTLWMFRVFSLELQEQREFFETIFHIKETLRSEKLLNFLSLCSKFIKKHFLHETIIPGHPDLQSIDQALCIFKAIQRCYPNGTKTTEIDLPATKTVLSSFTNLTREIQSLTIPNDNPLSIVTFPTHVNRSEKKRTLNEHKQSNQASDPMVIDLSNPTKKQKLDTSHINTAVVVQPLFFVPIELNINEPPHDLDFADLVREVSKPVNEEKVEEIPMETEEHVIEELNEDEKHKITELLLKLNDPLFSANETQTEEVIDGIDCIFGDKLEKALQFVTENEFTDETMKKLASVVISYDSLSYHQTLKFVRVLIYPKVQSLSQPASRILLATLLQLCDKQPKQVIEGILLEILKQDKTTPMNKFHVETLQRILSESLNKTSPDLLCHFLVSFLDESFPHHWNEMTVNFLCAIINQKFVLSPECFGLLLNQLQSNAEELGGILKFSSMLSSMLAKYSTQVAENKEIFGNIVSKITSRMKKSLVSRLHKL